MMRYEPYEGDRVYWCNAHNRKATYLGIWDDGRTEHRCDPKLGGVMLPCGAAGIVDITDMLEVATSQNTKPRF